MVQASATAAYIAAVANRFPFAADISQESLIAFGSHKFISLWNLPDERIHATLPGHEGSVTCLCFVSGSCFASGDDKGVLRCWEKSGSQWTVKQKVRAHGQPLSCMTYFDGYLITGSSDSTVKVWTVDPKDGADRIREKQTITFGTRYPLAVQMTRLPRSDVLVLAVSGTSTEVKIYTCSEQSFLPAASLPGHEDWVKCLAFQFPRADGEPLILASGSQDATIRLWNIEPLKVDSATGGADDLLDAFEASLGDTGGGEEGGRQISLKRHIVSVKHLVSPGDVIQKYSITFDALLVGHESGVTSVSWKPASPTTSSPVLLSTSTDSSLILWSPFDSLWVNRNRFGDIGGQRLGGFVGGLWNTDGEEILAWGWNGGWRRWKHDTNVEEDAVQAWSEANAVTGHNNVVKDICWSPRGEFLASTSLDQTTRIYGFLPKNSWREIARPQVHGYDLIGVQFLDALKFVSIADEKVTRVFEAPKAFVQLVKNLQVAGIDVDEGVRPAGATVPPLGLSNKAVDEVIAQNTVSQSAITTRPPFEAELASMTLWPEVEKVFGHGYESISIAASTSKTMFASTCKSTSPAHAVVRINSAQDDYRSVGTPLEGHSLTVTRVAFSPPDDKHVLSVSRDRSWRLYERKGDATDPDYTLVAADKSHARIIWDCAWSAEGDIFATASRDKTVKIWKNQEGKWSSVAVIKTAEAATALAFSPTDLDQRRRIAVGLENGHILIYSSKTTNPSECVLELTVDSSDAHVDQIHRITWRPLTTEGEGCGGVIKKQLASCSEDHTLRILNVTLKV